MTCRYMLGEFDLTDLATGQVDAHRITKAACGLDGGWVPANGLIYVTPKHCVCWPMLRGYAALGKPERPASRDWASTWKLSWNRVPARDGRRARAIGRQ